MRIRWIAVVLVATLLVAGTTMQARGQDVFSIIKTLGVGYAVRTFAPQINNFINDLLQNKGASVRAQTKVVPILSLAIGVSNPGGAYIGAAQVSGPASAVTKVQAVAEIEANFQNAFRIKALVPVDSLEPWKALRRVPGVGVSAIVDIRI
jgi:predicted small secreted protein